MQEFFNSETSWLTLTNIALGAVTLACFIAVARTAIMELAERRKASAPAWQDDHAFVFSDLGITMADGGEPIDEWERKSRNPSGEKDEPEHPASGPQ